jgi:hypothetical protein
MYSVLELLDNAFQPKHGRHALRVLLIHLIQVSSYRSVPYSRFLARAELEVHSLNGWSGPKVTCPCHMASWDINVVKHTGQHL